MHAVRIAHCISRSDHLPLPALLHQPDTPILVQRYTTLMDDRSGQDHRLNRQQTFTLVITCFLLSAADRSSRIDELLQRPVAVSFLPIKVPFII